jgi:hypothetical protein
MGACEPEAVSRRTGKALKGNSSLFLEKCDVFVVGWYQMEKYKFILATMWYVVKKILVSISYLHQARGSEGDRAGGVKMRLSGTRAG